ncbi:cytoglobin-1-like [Haemaphysalis longicornis]
MGQGHHKGHGGKNPLLSEREKKLVRDVWDAFCTKHRDYGSIILSSFFVAHPDLQKLFPAFRDKPVRTLKDDVKFRNHAIKFGDQLNSLIEALDKPAVLADLMRKTSHLHAGHKGVKPEHFVTMGRVIINVLTANHDRLMTGPAVKAWEKLFVCSDVGWV